jgi:hypothetical protein
VACSGTLKPAFEKGVRVQDSVYVIMADTLLGLCYSNESFCGTPYYYSVRSADISRTCRGGGGEELRIKLEMTRKQRCSSS